MHNQDMGIGSRPVRPRHKNEAQGLWRALRLAAVLAGTLVLSACGISQITSGLGGGVFGSSEDEPQAADWSATITEEGMLEAARSDTSGRIDASGPASGCPRFKIWPADRHITVYEPGRVGERLAMRHRGSITKVARECEINGQQVSVKYGFAGRVLMGPRGQDGVVDLPVNLYLTLADGSRIRSERVTVEVELRRENPVDYFSVVRTISFEAEPGTAPSSYKLFVAFDREIPGAT
jgi:hypothetical protein